MSDFLTRDQILRAADIKTEPIDVPEWGGKVLVRGLSGFERDQYEQSIIVGKGNNRDVNMRNARAKLVRLSCVDPAGQLLFSEDDVKVLGKKSAAALQRVFDKARKLSGLSDSDLDELTENFDNGQGDDSSSD
jgi:hypothetical protein